MLTRKLSSRERKKRSSRVHTPLRIESLEARQCLAAELDYVITSGANGSDVFDDIVLDTEGNFYVSTTAAVNKYSPTWDLLWSASVRDAYEIAVDAAGNVYATGPFSGSNAFAGVNGPVNISSHGSTDVFVVKFNASGKALWAHALGGVGPEGNGVVSLDPSGGVFVTGSFQQTATLGSFALTSAGADDVFVTHLSADGDIHWATRMGGASFDTSYSIATDQFGNAYLTGQYSGTATFGSAAHSLVSAGSRDVFVTKVSNLGDVAWAKSVGGSGLSDLGTSIVVDPAGFVTTAGHFGDVGDFDPGPGVFTLSGGSRDLFLLQLDFAGEFVWAKAMGGSGTEYTAQIALGPDGALYLTGNFRSSSGTTTDFDPSGGQYLLPSSGDDVFVLTIDRGGTLISARSFGGPSLDVGVGIVADAQGNAYVTGYFNALFSPADFDPGPGTALRNSVGNQDGFIVKLSPGTAAVGDLVWNDLNGNGLQDVAEPGLAGAVVELWFSTDSIQGNFDDSLVRTVVTDHDGSYLFDNLPSGQYYLITHAPVGFSFTTPNVGSNDQEDSDILPTGRSALFTLLRGQQDTSQDSGLGGASPDFGFGLRIGGTGDDRVNSVTTDADGNVYVTGQFTGTVDFDPGPGVTNLTAAGTDIFVAKYTSEGALAWAGRAGGTQVDRGVDLRVDVQGSVYVTGYFSTSFADMDPSASVYNLRAFGTSDIFLLKLDAQGNFVWAKSYSGGGGENVTSLDIDLSGNVYLAGNFFTNFVVPGQSPASNLMVISAGHFDGFIAKIDPAGNGISLQAIGGSGEDAINDIAVSDTGEVFLTGYFSGVADFNPAPGPENALYLTSAGSFDAFVLKLNADGALGWAKRYGSADADRGSNAIALDKAGNVYTSGDFQGTVSFDDSSINASETSDGPSDAFISKRDSAGNLIWVRTAGGTLIDSGRAITTDLSGDVYFTGSFQGTAVFSGGTVSHQLASAGNSDVFVAKYDAAGNAVSTYRLGGTLVDGGNAIAVDSVFGNVITAGLFRGAVDFDPGASVFSLAGEGVSDGFLWQFHQNSRPRDIQLSNNEISENQAGPQIVGDVTVVDTNHADTFTLELTDDADGRFYLDGNVLMVDSSRIDYEAHASHSITILATDHGGLSVQRSFVIDVMETNDVPVVTISGNTSVDEANAFIGIGSFIDADAEQWSAVVDYGDGSGPIALALNADHTFALSHVYSDNGLYVITVSVTDSRGGVGQNTWSVTVHNVAPTASPNAYTTAQATAVSGNLITDDTGSGPDSDPAGVWDPLAVSAITLPANGTLEWQSDGSFTYFPDSTFAGQDEFTYTLIDGDGGASIATVTINVVRAPASSVTTITDSWLGGTALLVMGSIGNDAISIGTGSITSTIVVQVNGILHEVMRPSGRIIVMAGDGNDSVTVAGAINNPAWIYGQDGDDHLNAGNGSSLLFGGAGNDKLLGGNNRDVMVGGDGADRLGGNGNEDILIAGYTSHDEPAFAGHEEFWTEVMEQWNADQQFSVRVQALRFYLSDYLNDDQDDDELDQLNGAAGDDWLIFAVGEDRVVGQEDEAN